MLTLYFFEEALCGIKVRLTLFEKGLDFEARKLTREDLQSPEYLSLNPEGLVPTLVVTLNGQEVALRESSVIMMYLDELSLQPRLSPEGPIQRAQMHWWMKRIDDVFFPAIGALTYATIMRTIKQPINEAAIDAELARIANYEQRQRRREILLEGLKSPIVRSSIKTIAEMVEAVDAFLQSKPYLSGPDYGLADSSITPLLERANWFGLIGGLGDMHESVTEYLQRMQARPSFVRLKRERELSPLLGVIDAILEPQIPQVIKVRDTIWNSCETIGYGSIEQRYDD